MKKYRVGIVILVFGIILFIIIGINRYIINNSIEKFEYKTIAKIYKYSTSRTMDIVYYYYYYNDIKFESNERVSDLILSEKNLTYFEIKISTENPSYSRIQLDKKVTDTLKIKAAGFSLDGRKDGE